MNIFLFSKKIEIIKIFLLFRFFFWNFLKNISQKLSILQQKQGQFWNLHVILSKTIAIDLAYKAIVCFEVALSASSGHQNRINKNMLKLLEENEVPKVYVTTIDLFLPTNPSSSSSSKRCFSEASASPNLSPPDIQNNSIDILETS